MNTISSFLSNDHTWCDELFAELERAVTQEQWDDAEALVLDFERAMERHFGMEEKVLFVAFEQATGNSDGPTSVMRTEHQVLRAVTSRISEGVRQRDADGFFGYADTLRVMLHQHNTKEESVLYLMTDRILSNRREEIMAAMREVGLETDFEAASVDAVASGTE